MPITITKVWDAQQSEENFSKVNPNVLDSHQFTHDFVTDFKEVCKKLNIVPNSSILNSFRVDSSFGQNDLRISNFAEISVKGLALDNGTVRALCASCKANDKIGRVIIWKTSLSQNSLKEIVEMMGSLDRPIELCLDWIPDVRQFLVSTPSENLTNDFSNLESLSLRSNSLTDSDIISLMEALSQCQQMEQLSLWDNQLGDEAAVRIGDFLRNHRKIAFLNLGKNKIGDSGAKYLSESIGAYLLTNQQVFERKKAVRELDKKRKEVESRKRRVAKGKSLKGTPSSESLESSISAVRKSSSKLEEPNYDLLIDEMTPIEIDGVHHSKGNRSLLHMNLSHNLINDLTVFNKVKELNKSIKEIVLTGIK